MPQWTAAEIIADELRHTHVPIDCAMRAAGHDCPGGIAIDGMTPFGPRSERIAAAIIDRLQDAGHLSR